MKSITYRYFCSNLLRRYCVLSTNNLGITALNKNATFTTNICFHRYFHSRSYKNCSYQIDKHSSYDTMLESLTSIRDLTQFTDTELCTLLDKLTEAKKQNPEHFLRTGNVRNLIEQLDNECASRASSWDDETLIMFYSKIVTFGRLIKPKLFIYILKKRYGKLFKRAPPALIIRYIKELNSQKKWKAYHVKWYLMEHFLMKHISELISGDVSIVLHALNDFNAQSTNDDLKNVLFQRLTDEINEMDATTRISFLQFFYNQYHLFSENQVKNFHIFLEKYVNKEDTTFKEDSLVILLCFNEKVYCKEMLEKVSSNLLNENLDKSISSVENALRVLTFLGFYPQSENFYEKLMFKFEFELYNSLVNDHSKRLVRLLYYLSLVGLYSKKLTDIVLSEEFLKKTYGKKLNKYTVPRQALILNAGIRIECPEYSGNVLNDNLYNNLLEYWSSNIPDPTDSTSSEYTKIISDLHSNFETVFDCANCVHLCYVLPHLSRPNLLFCLNNEGVPQQFPDSILNSIRVNSEELLKTDFIRCVFVAVTRDSTKSEPWGTEAMKIRQLKMLGYKVILVMENEWNAKSIQEKHGFIKNIVSNQI